MVKRWLAILLLVTQLRATQSFPTSSENEPCLMLEILGEKVPILLRPDIAPITVRQLTGMTQAGSDCGSPGACSIYRNEAVPDAPPEDCGAIGPCGPYSLVQVCTPAT